MEERLKEIITQLNPGSVTITSFSGFTEVNGIIPLEKFMQLVSGLMREEIKPQIVKSTTVMEPGQAKLTRPSFRNPHVDFKFVINKQA